MDFIKKNWLYLTLGVVALASIGTAAAAYMNGDSIVERMRKIEGLQNDLKREGSNPQNASTIEEQKAVQAELIARQETLLNRALRPQTYNVFEGRDRQVLVPGALPKPTNAVRFEFKTAYVQAYKELYRRLNAGLGATPEEILNEQQIEDAKGRGGDNVNLGPWAPKGGDAAAESETPSSGENKSVAEILKGYPKARAVEKKTRRFYMYVNENAMPQHPIANMNDQPETADIWYAQMTLWIQQDIAEALASVNDKRAETLKAQDRAYDCWVAHMPVKHLKALTSLPWLGKGGGGMGVGKPGTSFTGISNDTVKFVVPIQIQLVVEEAAMMDVIDSVCRIGFYTPTLATYRRVETSPLQDEYIYGDAPCVEVTLEFEGYYFRRVYDAWIPPEMATPLTRPRGEEELNAGRG